MPALRGPADMRTAILRSLPEIALDPQRPIVSLVICDNRASIAGRREILARVKAEATDRADRPRSPALDHGSVRLSCVLDDREARASG